MWMRYKGLEREVGDRNHALQIAEEVGLRIFHLWPSKPPRGSWEHHLRKHDMLGSYRMDVLGSWQWISAR
jgi:hypothetical protein